MAAGGAREERVDDRRVAHRGARKRWSRIARRSGSRTIQRAANGSSPVAASASHGRRMSPVPRTSVEARRPRSRSRSRRPSRISRPSGERAGVDDARGVPPSGRDAQHLRDELVPGPLALVDRETAPRVRGRRRAGGRDRGRPLPRRGCPRARRAKRKSRGDRGAAPDRVAARGDGEHAEMPPAPPTPAPSPTPPPGAPDPEPGPPGPPPRGRAADLSGAGAARGRGVACGGVQLGGALVAGAWRLERCSGGPRGPGRIAATAWCRPRAGKRRRAPGLEGAVRGRRAGCGSAYDCYARIARPGSPPAIR